MQQPSATRDVVWPKVVPGTGHHQLHIRSLDRQPPAKVDTRDIAGELGVGDDHLDLRVPIKDRLGVVRVIGMKCLETRFTKNVGRDHADKWLVFDNQGGGSTRSHIP